MPFHKRFCAPESQSQIGIAEESIRAFQELSVGRPAYSPFVEPVLFCTHYECAYNARHRQTFKQM
jgi:hypothetical protein